MFGCSIVYKRHGGEAQTLFIGKLARHAGAHVGLAPTRGNSARNAQLFRRRHNNNVIGKRYKRRLTRERRRLDNGGSVPFGSKPCQFVVQRLVNTRLRDAIERLRAFFRGKSDGCQRSAINFALSGKYSCTVRVSQLLLYKIPGQNNVPQLI